MFWWMLIMLIIALSGCGTTTTGNRYSAQCSAYASQQALARRGPQQYTCRTFGATTTCQEQDTGGGDVMSGFVYGQAYNACMAQNQR